jgi:hypothetical protein
MSGEWEFKFGDVLMEIGHLMKYRVVNTSPLGYILRVHNGMQAHSEGKEYVERNFVKVGRVDDG